MKDKPSPELQAAAFEIREILKKYDIGGHIILASKTHGEYLMHFPAWSKAQFEIDDRGNPRGQIRFKAKGKDEVQTIASTVHMIQVIQQIAGNLFIGMDNLMKNLNEKMKIEGGPFRVYPEQCPNCGNTDFAVARDMIGTRHCKCGKTWVSNEQEKK